MSDDDILAELGHHPCRYFTGVCAFGLPVDILRTQTNIGALQERRNRHKAHKGRAKHLLHTLDCTQNRRHFGNQCARFRNILIHLPVSCNKWCTHYGNVPSMDLAAASIHAVAAGLFSTFINAWRARDRVAHFSRDIQPGEAGLRENSVF